MAKKFWAIVNEENIVENVVVGNEDYANEYPEEGKRIIETVQGGPKNYAGIGYTYSDELDDFLSPKPYPSWIINGNKWEAPSPKPEGDFWRWDEETLSWVETTEFPDM